MPYAMKRLAIALVLCLFVDGVATIVGAADDAEAVKQRLVGNWTLAKYEVFGEDGAVRPGNYDVGRIMYGDAGEMTFNLRDRRDRTEDILSARMTPPTIGLAR